MQREIRRVANVGRLLYGLSFPMSEEAQKDDFVIPVRLDPSNDDPHR
jgi:hypothetical protein